MAAWSPREAADLAALLTVPDGMPWLTVANDQLKPGAVAVVTADSGNQVLVAAQQYGAGKVALVNVSETWRWAMREERGPELHARFWARLTAWAASSLQQRLTIKPAGAKLDLASEQRVTVDVLDRYYRPESRARLTAVCRVPGGGEERVEFVPDPRVDGRYVSRFVPRATGEHRWSFRVELPDGEVLEEQVDQVVVDASPEHLPAPLAEERLRSLARITGGQYYHVRDLGELTDLPITRQIRYLETPHPWLHSWLFLLAIVLAVLPDWIARRRTGLR
jgi:hypothetical protein